MLEKQEVKIDLLKANIGAKKQKENLVLLMADTTIIRHETRACYNE
jgi:hypothetical protein